MSSALVPPSVTKRLQETHHTVVPVTAPISVPVMASMVVGGPSCAPVQVPMTITLFKPSGVTYTKTEAPKNAQAFSGFIGQEGPHTMRKPPVAWKGAAPSKPPVSLEARMACATIVDNAVASSSHQTLDLPPAPLLEHIAMPTLAEQAAFDAHQKAKRKTCQGNKKGKKDSVHKAPLDPSLKGKNVQIFDNTLGDRVSHRTYIISHFTEILNEYLDKDPSGSGLVKMFDPYLDAPSDGEQDSSLEDEEMGCSLQLFTLPQDKDTVKDHWEDYKLDAQHDSHMDDDYGYQRYVSNFDINTVADRQQLLVALGSLSSSVEQYMPHSANCVKCKTNKRQDLIELLADSSTLLNFTHEQSDLSEFQEVHDEDFDVQTAVKSPPLAVKGVGCMFLTTSATSRTRSKKLICLYPVFYIPGINHRFLSVGTLLNQRLMLTGSSSHLEFRSHKSN